MKTILILIAVVVVVGGGAAYYATYLSADPPPSFRTVTVKRDTLLLTIGATGTAEPEDSIDMGAQVTGKIQSFGRDPHDPSKSVDFCTAVEEGTLLATIDPTLYQAQFDQAAASLAHAKADLLELQAKCDQTKQEWKRAQGLLPQKAIADTDYDLAKANWLVAEANVEVGKTTIEQCKAELALAKTNLDYCTIKSPVKGVIIDRRVNVGQTIVSAMSTSSLFLLAKDLQRMQVWASVNEADIGRIHAGMLVHFTIATYPGETFEGKVSQVRLNAQSTQNVVTYTVVVATDNPPTAEYPYGKLLPCMTADLKFEIERHPDVLLVPNAALRWKPQPSQIAPDARRKNHTNTPVTADNKDNKADSPSAKPASASGAQKTQPRHERLWVIDGDFVRPVKVRVTATDGAMTEVSGDGLKEGMKVVIGEGRSADSAEDGDATTNPFLPKLRPGATPPKPKQ